MKRAFSANPVEGNDTSTSYQYKFSLVVDWFIPTCAGGRLTMCNVPFDASEKWVQGLFWFSDFNSLNSKAHKGFYLFI